MNEASRVSKEEKDRLKCDYNLLEEERDRLLKQIEENKVIYKSSQILHPS